MEQAQIVRLVLVAMFVALLVQGSVLEAILQAISNFRGGPPTPKHPLPADDSVILRRKRLRVPKEFLSTLPGYGEPDAGQRK
jgi:hypothetical protein